MNNAMYAALHAICELDREFVNQARGLDLSVKEDLEKHSRLFEPFHERLNEFKNLYVKPFWDKFESLDRQLTDECKRPEDVMRILGSEDSIVDVTTIKLVFKSVIENGAERIVGGEVVAKDKSGCYRLLFTSRYSAAELVENHIWGCDCTQEVDNRGADFENAWVAFFESEYLCLHK